MPTSPEELARLRATAARKTKNMTDKMSRVKMEHWHDNQFRSPILSGSGWDFRKHKDELSRMTAASLRKYIREADVFLSRKTKFISAGGEPLLKSSYEAYKAHELNYNKLAGRVYKYGDLWEKRNNPNYYKDRLVRENKKPFREQWQLKHPDKIRLVDKDDKYFNDQGVLNRALKDMKRRDNKNYLKKVVKDIRYNLKQLGIDTSETYGISNEALAYLWQHGKLAHKVKEWYEIQKQMWKFSSEDMQGEKYGELHNRSMLVDDEIRSEIQHGYELDRFNAEEKQRERNVMNKGNAKKNKKKSKNMGKKKKKK